MDLRYPDKPNELSAQHLQYLDDQHDSIAQQKLDGWRCLIVRDDSNKFVEKWGGERSWYRGRFLFLSRRAIDKGGPTSFPVSDQVVQAVSKLNLPDQSMLDGEWLNRRTKEDQIGECLYLFDVLWFDDLWQGRSPLINRLELLDQITSRGLSQYLRVPDSARNGFVEFFETQKKLSWTEGVVIKELDSTIVGDRSGSVKNGSWIKVKWRSGHDGRQIIS